MANFPPLFLNTTLGRPERLLPADGGLQIDVIDCAAANTNVRIFATPTGGGGTTVEFLSSYTGTALFGATGSTISFVGGARVTQGFRVDGATLLDGDVTLGDTNADVVTVPGKIAGQIVFVATANHDLSVANGILSLTASGTGSITATSATSLGFAATAGAATLTAGTTMSLTSTGNATVGTSGAATSCTLRGQGASVLLNQAAPNASLVGFTATSIVGGLNELRASVATASPSNVVGEAGGVVVGDLLCLADDAGTPKLYKCDNANAARNKPVGVSLEIKAAGAACRYTTTGSAIINTLLLAANTGAYVFMDTGAGAGKVTVTPPVAGTVMVVGIVSKGGAAGTAEIIYQPLLPTVW